MAHLAVNQWQLSKVETVTTFENWRQNLVHILSQDPIFADFVVEGLQWQKKTAATPTRGLQNDGEDVPAQIRKTANQKVVQLELMLGQIANFCPIIAHNNITKRARSLDDIWQLIRQHFGFKVIEESNAANDVAIQPAKRQSIPDNTSVAQYDGQPHKEQPNMPSLRNNEHACQEQAHDTTAPQLQAPVHPPTCSTVSSDSYHQIPEHTQIHSKQSHEQYDVKPQLNANTSEHANNSSVTEHPSQELDLELLHLEPADDQALHMTQHEAFVSNHPFSGKSKAHGHGFCDSPTLCVSDVVHTLKEREKANATGSHQEPIPPDDITQPPNQTASPPDHVTRPPNQTVPSCAPNPRASRKPPDLHCGTDDTLVPSSAPKLRACRKPPDLPHGIDGAHAPRRLNGITRPPARPNPTE